MSACASPSSSSMPCVTSPPGPTEPRGPRCRGLRRVSPGSVGAVGAPLIGLSGRRWPARALGEAVPPAMHGVEFDLHFADYPQAIAPSGGLPVELARDADVEGVIRSEEHTSELQSLRHL